MLGVNLDYLDASSLLFAIQRNGCGELHLVLTSEEMDSPAWQHLNSMHEPLRIYESTPVGFVKAMGGPIDALFIRPTDSATGRRVIAAGRPLIRENGFLWVSGLDRFGRLRKDLVESLGSMDHYWAGLADGLGIWWS